MKRILEVFRMVKIEHTLFALPFAFIGVLFAAGGWPGWRLFFQVILAMVFARSAAMAFNRLVDVDIDAQNPRTRDRALPARRLSYAFVATFVGINSAAFMVTCWFINSLAFKLSPLALSIVLLYSYAKRYTALSHVLLGIGLAIAPTGGWIAVQNAVSLPPLLLSAGVMFWVAGFDILYSLQDETFDRARGLHSIPVALGVSHSLMVARLFHLLTFVLFVAFSISMSGGLWFNLGVGVSALLLIYEHNLISPRDLSRLNAAFFTVNSFVSIILLVFAVLKFVM